MLRCSPRPSPWSAGLLSCTSSSGYWRCTSATNLRFARSASSITSSSNPAQPPAAPPKASSSAANRKEKKLASVFQYFATHDPSSSTALPVPPATVDFVRSITDEERKAALTFFTKNAAFLASSVAAPNLPDS